MKCEKEVNQAIRLSKRVGRLIGGAMENYIVNNICNTDNINR